MGQSARDAGKLGWMGLDRGKLFGGKTQAPYLGLPFGFFYGAACEAELSLDIYLQDSACRVNEGR